MSDFPVLSDALRLKMLQPPTGPVRVLFDTDTANEIDDQYALAWALLTPDRITVEASIAEPFSFLHRLLPLRDAYDLRHAGRALSADEAATVEQLTPALDAIAAVGHSPHDDTMPDTPTDEGMERSYEEILKVYALCGVPSDGRVYRGAPHYMPDRHTPVESDGVAKLIALARVSSSDDPLYVVAIGCITNVASALLIAPDIVDKIVVTWTAGYPVHAVQQNNSLNLEQDVAAAQVVLDSGVPFVYLPGFHIGAQLRLSLPEMEAWVRGRGAIGDYLYHLYTHNPLHPFLGVGDHYATSWVIWDVINVAWLLHPAWVPSYLTPTPILDDARYWHAGHPARHTMRESHAINRDAIFRDFFDTLKRAP